MKFEWDENKNLKNIKNHGISFEEAASLFSDIDAISIFDDDHSEYEERWVTLGRITQHDIIVVVHTERLKGKFEFIRIISARKAGKNEKNEYIKRIGGK